MSNNNDEYTFQEFYCTFTEMTYKIFRSGYGKMLTNEFLRHKNKEHYDVYKSQLRLIMSYKGNFHMLFDALEYDLEKLPEWGENKILPEWVKEIVDASFTIDDEQLNKGE